MCCLFCDAHSHDWNILSDHMTAAHLKAKWIVMDESLRVPARAV